MQRDFIKRWIHHSIQFHSTKIFIRFQKLGHFFLFLEDEDFFPKSMLAELEVLNDI